MLPGFLVRGYPELAAKIEAGQKRGDQHHDCEGDCQLDVRPFECGLALTVCGGHLVHESRGIVVIVAAAYT